ncbi:hypothetical protein STAS_21105 [Striga asiatica]|uniref:Uncharacterized protein n=1 Tax=Striga asiatica TaxID=4170 RepID=A0A5A7QGM6_STRAF|nr:hypothetical protein STAS_21105 [Striga asiatica]
MSNLFVQDINKDGFRHKLAEEVRLEKGDSRAFAGPLRLLRSVDVYCLGTRALLQIKKGCVSVGYVQNPLSLYFCYDVEGTTRTLSKCITEVTNTPWGERVTFLSNLNSDLVAKPLHVSPFMVGHPWELENENELTK